MRRRKREYRYRDHAGGVTRPSREALQHLPKIGNPTLVRGYCYKSAYNNRLAVLVRGDKGSARFEGFCWGYSGEGPSGLRQLFTLLRIPVAIAEEVAFKGESPDWTKPRNYWSLQLHPDGGYDLHRYNEEGEVIEHRRYTMQEHVTRERQLRLAM